MYVLRYQYVLLFVYYFYDMVNIFFREGITSTQIVCHVRFCGADGGISDAVLYNCVACSVNRVT